MIHPELVASLARLEAQFRSDPRCVAMYTWGSLGSSTDDPYSDVDAAIVVQDSEYHAIVSKLRAVCESQCGPILAWLPEGERRNSCNFAFLFKFGDDLLLYDFYVSALSAARQGPGGAQKKVLFDRADLFTEPIPTLPEAPESGIDLVKTITEYWVYIYLNGKYQRRNDIYKMLYVQQKLLQAHLRVLLAMHQLPKLDWWPRAVHQLPNSYQSDLRVYFPAPEMGAIVQALSTEARLFSRDALAACTQQHLQYSKELEEGVLRHLHRMRSLTSLLT